MSDGIAFNGRTLVVGVTGSGKSELLNVQFSAFRCQRVLYDSKHEFSVPDVHPVTADVDMIDWRQPIVHFRPGEDTRGDADRFFRAAFGRPNPLVVAVHELGDLCDYNANGAPAAVKRYFVQGRALGKGLIGGTQRPVGIPKQAFTEANDFFVFVPRPSQNDLATVAQELGYSMDDLGRLLDGCQSELGDHSFLRWSRRDRQLVRCPPLPAKIRRRSVVKRLHDH